jgi:hypothetical protein
MKYKETDDIWRLYRREWVTVHTVSMAESRLCRMAAGQWVKENLTDRVHSDDIELDFDTDGATRYWCHIRVFKDNLKGEFKYQSNAVRHAAQENYEEYAIVARNSKADHDIRSYGVKKL